MYQELFIYPAIGAFTLLLVHSWKVRGVRFTIMYFLGGFAFGLVRELFYVNLKHNYDYSGMALKILGVSPVIPLGWMFTFYIGLCFGERILGFTCNGIRDGLRGADALKVQETWKNKAIPLLSCVGIFTGIVCFAIESCAITMGWWEYIGYTGSIVTNPVQYMWTQTGLIFTMLFLLGYFKAFRTRKNMMLLAVFTAKYAAEEFIYDYLPPWGVMLLWLTILIAPVVFYSEFSMFYLILLFGGRLFPNIFFIEAPAAYFIIMKLVFFVPQAVYLLAHLYPRYAILTGTGLPLAIVQ